MSDASIVHLSKGNAQIAKRKKERVALVRPLSIEYSKMGALFQALEAQMPCEKIFGICVPEKA